MFAKTLDISYSDSILFVLLLETVGIPCVSFAGTQCKGDPHSPFLSEMVAKPESTHHKTQTSGVTNLHSGMMA